MLLQKDYRECLNSIPNKSIDMVLTDLPYGTTQNKWDTCIDLDIMWEELNRVCKERCPKIFTAQTPFDKILGSSNIKELKYEWIWEKTTATGHLNAKKMPMKAHENILVFYKKLPYYNPQKTQGHSPVHSYTKYQDDGTNYGETLIGISGGGSTERYPRGVITFPTDKQVCSLHPTQKPVSLMEYLIKTYTKKDDVILDFCCGSGSNLVAAQNLKRRFIGCDNGYCEKDKIFKGVNIKGVSWIDVCRLRLGM